MTDIKTKQEFAWKHLGDFPNQPIDDCPNDIEPITTNWDIVEKIVEEFISWEPRKVSLWRQTSIARIPFFEFLIQDIEEKWQPQSIQLFKQLDIGTFEESWSQWWSRMRTLPISQQVQAAWILQTFIRAHPNLYVWVGLNGISSKGHPLGEWVSRTVWNHPVLGNITCQLLIDETFPLDTNNEEDSRMIRNLLQELIGCHQSIPEHFIEKCSGFTWRLLVIPPEAKLPGKEQSPIKEDWEKRWKCGWDISGMGWGWDLARQRQESHAWMDAVVHMNSIDRLFMIPHRPIPTTNWWLGYIWRRWMTYNVAVRDRLRFVIAGGMVKSSWGLRDAKDLDFLVCDHSGKLEGNYHPNLGSPLLKHFHDFGRTYYPCEKYFFPVRPEWYKAQKNYRKSTIQTEKTENTENTEELFGSQWIPKFSASGLKASRYFPMLQWLWDRYRQNDDDIPPLLSLDDLMLNPQLGFYRGGMKYAPIEWEFQRDHLKDIDLGWVSKKQVGDIDTYQNLYGENPALGFTKRNGEWTPSLTWKWNIYHGDLITDPATQEPVGLEVKIRRAPDSLHRIIRTWIRESGFPCMTTEWNKERPWRVEIVSNGIFIHHWNDIFNQTIGMEQLVARQVLLSSLPSTIEYKDKQVPAIWWWVLTQKGEIHVSLWIHPWNVGSSIPQLAKGEPWIAGGTCQVVYPDIGKAKLTFCLIQTEEAYRKESNTSCFNLSRFLTSLKYKFLEHKTFDAQQTRSWAVDYSPDLIVPDWETLPWISMIREKVEQEPYLQRWIPAPSPAMWDRTKGSKLQEKLGFVYQEDPTIRWKEVLSPKIKLNRKSK